MPYNRGMTQLALLLPFALPQKELARDLLRELKMPAFATLLARGNLIEQQISDGFSRALPHENWLAQQFGLAMDSNSSPSVSVNAMSTFGLQADTGVWFILQPVHLHIARDHLVLTDPQQLQLSEQDARGLFDTVQPLFEETGRTLLYGDARTWFLRADDLQALHTSTPDAACGHNIDIWMPKGANERDWRRLQNEVQMHWHGHAINNGREAIGFKPVNSVWLWGGTSTTQISAPHKIEATFTLAGTQHLFVSSTAKQITVSSATDLIASKPQQGLLVLDSLIAPAMAGDWSEWLGRLQAMETEWFAPLLEAIKNGQLDQLNITLSHNTALSTIAIQKSSLRKFWHKPSLARLVP